MAISYTRTAYSGPPVLTLSLLEGGSLDPDTTYYYRAATSNHYYQGSSSYRSAASVVKSITTTATHRSVQIDIVHSTGNPEYTYIWCAKGSDPGTGNWCKKFGPQIVFLGTSSLNFLATGGANKITQFVDNGASAGWYWYIYFLDAYGTGGTANYGYVPFYEDAKDFLSISGSTSEDPLTFEKLYAEAVAQGWPLESTIKKIDGIVNSDFGIGAHTVYSINAAVLTVWGFFETNDAVVYLNDCNTQLRDEVYIGEYDSSVDLSRHGVKFYLTGHSTCFGRIYFYGSEPQRVYDTDVLVRKYDWSLALSYTALFSINSTDWEFIDCELSGGLDAGLSVNNASATCLAKRVLSQDNRYGGRFSVASAFIASDLKMHGGFWPAQIYDDTPREYREFKIVGKVGYGAGPYGSVAIVGSYRTISHYIDSEIYDYTRMYWYRGAGTVEDVSYLSFRFTVAIRVIDQDGNGLDGATVVAVNKDGVEQFSETTSGGGYITAGEIERYRAKPNLALGSHYQDPDYFWDYAPFTITISCEGYDEVIIEESIGEKTDWTVSMQVAGKSHVEAILAALEGDAEVIADSGEIVAAVEPREVTVTVDD